MVDLTQKTDTELVVLTLEAADNFVFLMKRYEGRLLAYIKRLSSISNEEAEDILQEVFIKVYQNLNDFNPKMKFSSWIYRITHNEVISRFRKTKARPQSISWDASEELFNKIADDFNIEHQVNREIIGDKIKKTLNQLEEKYREVIVLKYFEDKDYKEISDILKKPSGTVATLLNRAKKQLKELLAKNLEKLS
jgi:RNA polymerase sigma-70 factor, ECF subfamily